MRNGYKPVNPIVQEENIGQREKVLICTEIGLTKREYFAGLAMQGLLLNSTYDFMESEQIAKASLKIANNLLEELERTEINV